MTTQSPHQDNGNDSFSDLVGPGAGADSPSGHVEQVAVDLADAGISYALMPDEKARAITEARQRSMDDHPLAPLAEGLGAGLTVPQPIPSEETPGHSYVTYSAPAEPEEPSYILTSVVSLAQSFGNWVSTGPVGQGFKRLDDFMSRFEDQDTVELRKIHPLLGSGLGLPMTDADIPGQRPKDLESRP